MGRLIGPGEAARTLGVSTRTIQRWLREGRLPGITVGSRTKVDEATVRALAAEAGLTPGLVERPDPARAPSRVTDPDAAPDAQSPDIAVPGAEEGVGVTHAASAGRGPRADARRPSGEVPIRRLIVANRGELVARIARTTRRLGITCLALASGDEHGAWWTTEADDVVRLDGSYLDADAVLRAATAAGADALHPGYGFLAEDASFAEAVEAAGLIWVGPPPAAMRALGDKAAARRLAAELDVPVVPGYDGDAQSDDALAEAAATVGYPILVKPSAGGGGKGMHVVRDPAQLRETLARARREARLAFGDDRLVLERYIARPRHIEVQLLLDAHGNGVHLGERECSVQRRHQKVIEEAPSPAVDAALRGRLGEAALRLARAAGYVGAGTAEFLVTDAGEWFFLELNARLQVEHPVTESVTGRDLVADQLRVAAGDPLGFTQDDVRFEGHAIEARVYAEDPWAGFVPATGTVREARWPSGRGVRVDAGVGSGDEVGTRYDPMLGKVIAHGASRPEALERLSAALRETSILGVTTNTGFLRRLLARPEMVAGDARTDLVDRHWRPKGGDSVPDAAFPAAAAALAAVGAADAGPPRGFRLNAPASLRLRIGAEVRSVAVSPERDAGPVPSGAATGSDGTPVSRPGPAAPAGGPPQASVANVARIAEDAVVLDIDGRAWTARLAGAPSVEEAVLRAGRAETGGRSVEASMPGTVLAVHVAEGDAVDPGQTLVVLEAMKMENSVAAPAAGTVARVLVAVGDRVARGQPLVELA